MAIDGKKPSLWTEEDLQEFCDEQRRETQRLEFKRELKVDTNGEKNEVERDALGMATDGGGVIVYGVEEHVTADGGRAAAALRPLTDGALSARLEEILDTRGEPRLSFDLYEVRASRGGFYLVLDIHGRRRPHLASDGRYYGRRGTRVRRMTEAEVEEAYRDRFIRERRAMDPVLGGGDEVEDEDDGLPRSVVERIHLGLKPNELALWREETGYTKPPGWMSVVVVPNPMQREVLDPIKDHRLFEPYIDIPTRWDPDHRPMQYFDLEPTLEGLYSQLPPRDDMAPAYLVAMYRDGLMEYGTTLEPGLRDDSHPERNRIIFTASHPQMAHDYLSAFGVALGKLGYDGDVTARVSFENTRGVTLGLSQRDIAPLVHPIEVDRVSGELWRLRQNELPTSAGHIVKEVMDRVFLAAGLHNGTWHINDSGHWVG